MSNSDITYSVVVPVYNSQDSLVELYERTAAVFQELEESFEMIFVEDAGSDHSWEVLVELQKKYKKNITIIQLNRNYGQHNALFCGFFHTKGQFIITSDDDLQTPPEEIPKLIVGYQQNQADVVYGFYPQKKHSFVRKIGSSFIKRMGVLISDGPGEGSSFRMLTRNLINKLLLHKQSFIYIDELLPWYTKNMVLVPVRHIARKHGNSSYSWYRLIKLMVTLMLFRSATLIRLVTYMGLLFSILSVLFILYFISVWFFFDIPVQGFTATIVSIFFFGSVNVFCLGIIGEFIYRIYTILNQRPQYTIKQIIK